MRMERTTLIALIFAVLVAGWILVTGQWAYGNVVGPLVNYSKLPKLEVTYVRAVQYHNETLLIINVTDVDGPDAYPATAPLIEIYNSTWHVYLNSTQISNYTVKVVQAPWNENKKDNVNWYSGLIVPLGSEGQFQLLLPMKLSPGKYTMVLYTPGISLQSEAKTSFILSTS